MEDYCCPNCGSTLIDTFDEKDCEINLEDETVYLRNAITCSECGHEFTMVVEAELSNFKIKKY